MKNKKLDCKYEYKECLERLEKSAKEGERNWDVHLKALRIKYRHEGTANRCATKLDELINLAFEDDETEDEVQLNYLKFLKKKVSKNYSKEENKFLDKLIKITTKTHAKTKVENGMTTFYCPTCHNEIGHGHKDRKEGWISYIDEYCSKCGQKILEGNWGRFDEYD